MQSRCCPSSQRTTTHPPWQSLVVRYVNWPCISHVCRCARERYIMSMNKLPPPDAGYPTHSPKICVCAGGVCTYIHVCVCSGGNIQVGGGHTADQPTHTHAYTLTLLLLQLSSVFVVMHECPGSSRWCAVLAVHTYMSCSKLLQCTAALELQA